MRRGVAIAISFRVSLEFVSSITLTMNASPS